LNRCFLFLWILERCKPTQNDIENREKILKQLQKQFEKDYPDCNLHAFGSFYNGFGFRQSDLDVCIVVKDQKEENVCILRRSTNVDGFLSLFLFIRLMKLFILWEKYLNQWDQIQIHSKMFNLYYMLKYQLYVQDIDDCILKLILVFITCLYIVWFIYFRYKVVEVLQKGDLGLEICEVVPIPGLKFHFLVSG